MTFFDELAQPGTSTIIASAITALVSIQTLFLKWLIDSFAQLRKDLQTQATTSFQWLMAHEEKDQERHLDNLKRFEAIAVSLALAKSDRAEIATALRAGNV